MIVRILSKLNEYSLCLQCNEPIKMSWLEAREKRVRQTNIASVFCSRLVIYGLCFDWLGMNLRSRTLSLLNKIRPIAGHQTI